MIFHEVIDAPEKVVIHVRPSIRIIIPSQAIKIDNYAGHKLVLYRFRAHYQLRNYPHLQFRRGGRGSQDPPLQGFRQPPPAWCPLRWDYQGCGREGSCLVDPQSIRMQK